MHATKPDRLTAHSLQLTAHSSTGREKTSVDCLFPCRHRLCIYPSVSKVETAATAATKCCFQMKRKQQQLLEPNSARMKVQNIVPIKFPSFWQAIQRVLQFLILLQSTNLLHTWLISLLAGSTQAWDDLGDPPTDSPTSPFHNFSASNSGHWRILCSSRPSSCLQSCESIGRLVGWLAPCRQTSPPVAS